jgi:hypothetical protein
MALLVLLGWLIPAVMSPSNASTPVSNASLPEPLMVMVSSRVANTPGK